jgi:membrane dipeptidase
MRYSLVVLALGTGACATLQPSRSSSDVSSRALQIYRDAVVVDTHNDMPSRVLDDGYNPHVRHKPGFGRDDGETDFPRLVQSGLTAEFLAAFVDAEYAQRVPDASFSRAMVFVDTIVAFVARHPDGLTLATSASEVRKAKEQGRVAILIGIEGGHAIEGSLENLRELYRRGARTMTLTWNNGNSWAGSSIGQNGTSKGGLTQFGRDVVREMNRLGMLVDVSHVSDSTFFDVISTTRDPVIASHSSVRALNDHPRNLSDAQLRAIAQNGGVVNVNFYAPFIDPRFRAAKDSIEREAELAAAQALRKASAASDTSTILSLSRRDASRLVQQLPAPPLSVLIDHFDHVVRIAGVDHVGIGSDFDGVSGYLPAGMQDITALPRIVQALLDRGYQESDIKKILGGNMLRVMQQVLDRPRITP